MSKAIDLPPVGGPWIPVYTGRGEIDLTHQRTGEVIRVPDTSGRQRLSEAWDAHRSPETVVLDMSGGQRDDSGRDRAQALAERI